MGVRRIVTDFYQRVLGSPVIGHHFDGVDMRRLIDHQTQFITFAMGGPASVSDEQLRRVHARLGITSGEFRTMCSLLREALTDGGLPQDDVDHVCREVDRREYLIVTRDEAS